MKLQTFFFFFLFASTATTGSAIWWDIFKKEEENECDSEHDCTEKEFCDKDNEPRTCVPKREDGEQCSRDAKCLSDKCVNNVCKAQHHHPNNNKDKCQSQTHEHCTPDLFWQTFFGTTGWLFVCLGSTHYLLKLNS